MKKCHLQKAFHLAITTISYLADELRPTNIHRRRGSSSASRPSFRMCCVATSCSEDFKFVSIRKGPYMRWVWRPRFEIGQVLDFLATDVPLFIPPY
jgi:hypothetical protein